MNPAILAISIVVLSGVLGAWGLLGLVFTSSLLWVPVLVVAVVPLGSAVYEVYGRDRSAFVHFDGTGWLILTLVGTVVTVVLFTFVAGMLSPGGTLVVAAVLLVPAALGYVAYLRACLRGEAERGAPEDDGVSELLAEK